MSIGTRIKELRTNLKFTQEELATKIGVTKGAIANYEKEVSIPKPEIMYKIFSALNCDANYLYQDDITSLPLKNNIYSSSEKELITNYRNLDNYGKKAVNTIMNIELERINGMETERTNNKIIPIVHRYTHYDIPVSAGTGEPLDVSTAVMVELNVEPPLGTDYILRIAGNSMEPKFFDGDYIYVKQANQLNYGDIGIFVYQGSVYMKEYTSDGLKSLNPNYPIINGTNDIRCLGRVLGVVDGSVKIIN